MLFPAMKLSVQQNKMMHFTASDKAVPCRKWEIVCFAKAIKISFYLSASLRIHITLTDWSTEHLETEPQTLCALK